MVAHLILYYSKYTEGKVTSWGEICDDLRSPVKEYHAGGGLIAFKEADSGLLPTDRIVTSQLANPREGMQLVEAAP